MTDAPRAPFTNVCAAGEAVPTYRCPCCKFKTLCGRAGYEICPVCYWEDDGQDEHDADLVRGGPNGELSLRQAQKNFLGCRACDPRYVASVREPLPAER
jgi:Cysteine-rich CPCC